MNDTKRCGACLGTGIKGRWVRATAHAARFQRVVGGKVWYVGACRPCGGRGEVPKKTRAI